MRVSKISLSIATLAILTIFTSANTAFAQQNQMNMKGMCQDLSPEMQQFASKLNMNNKMLFCSKFNDSQRTQAMQMATQKDSYGKQKMTPNKSVEMIAAQNNLTIP